MKSEYENTIQDLEQRNIMLKDNEDSLNWQV